MKHLAMKRRHERRALTAGGHVARAKIRHGGDAGALGDHGRVADLQRERMCRARPVPQRLAVAADGADVLFIKTRLLDYGIGRFGKETSEGHVQFAEAFDFVGAGAHQGLDLAAHRGWNRMRMGGDQDGFAIGGDGDQRGIDAVHAGS